MASKLVLALAIAFAVLAIVLSKCPEEIFIRHHFAPRISTNKKNASKSIVAVSVNRDAESGFHFSNNTVFTSSLSETALLTNRKNKYFKIESGKCCMVMNGNDFNQYKCTREFYNGPWECVKAKTLTKRCHIMQIEFKFFDKN